MIRLPKIIHFLSESYYKKKRHTVLCKIFHVNLMPAIQVLSRDPVSFKPEDFTNFTDAFHAQEITVLKIQDNLFGNQLSRFNTLWNEYKEWKKICDSYESTAKILALQSKRKQVLTVVTELLNIAKKPMKPALKFGNSPSAFLSTSNH